MKRLLKYLKSYKKECVLGPLFKMFEATLELIVPLVIAAIIDNGIEGGAGRSYVVLMSLLLVFLGAAGLGGMLIGGLVSAIMLAVFMANAGGAWDNAKKYIESGKFGGKGSDTHKAAITGDTVGDPLKDTSGPAMDILIKLMSVISLVLVPVLVELTPRWDLILKLFAKI